jgi:type III restriction enzyme
MKLNFEPNLDFQLQAVEAVCGLFHGQEINRTEFTVTRDVRDPQLRMDFAQGDLGFGNRLTRLDDEILKNLREIQFNNGLPQSETLASGDFTVEMETGTGKTYVYLRTIFELNKQYGFTKFVIVVPSVAIKEGVYKSLQITEEHFKALYAGVPYDYFIYDSAKLGQVRNFATSSTVQIMVVTVHAINKFGDETEAAAEESDESRRRGKSKNVMYRPNDKTGGEKPIDLIRSTSPILIIDEPQSVDGGIEGRGKKALERMNALCTLRYSATHVDKHHMVYRLDAVDAYEQKLVKQIEVAAATVEDAHNKPYVRLLSVENKRNRIYARVELDIQDLAGNVERRETAVQDGDNLKDTAGGREIYNDYRIGEISVRKGKEYMELRYPGGEKFMKPGEAHGDVDAFAVQSEMIRRTIREHFEKEKRLRPQGIKVLSLIFIDTVSKYRQYDESGNPKKGVYAEIFEKEYKRVAKLPEFNTLFKEVDLNVSAKQAHEGYFSIDRKGGWTDTEDSNQTGRDNAERAYNLIMKDKEKLLSFDTPLKFIFSHSALREGWDNPNVFQICTLRDIHTERERRQTIGRGLRLCVNQEGQRLRGFEVNTLTVIANEGYEEFAEKLQKEIEIETGIKFGVVESHNFAAISEGDIELPDLLTELQDRTQLTRRSIYRILIDSGRLNDFKRNPQQFIELATEAIDRCKRLAIVEGIKYQRLGDECYYAQELFKEKELSGYLRNLLDVKKSVFEQVVYESDTEREFADQLEKNMAFKVYAKLPGWFTVPTPLGSYNPDWAVLMEKDGEERVYFVVETKSGLFADDLRLKERAKIDCGKAHFNELAKFHKKPAVYKTARAVDDLLATT